MPRLRLNDRLVADDARQFFASRSRQPGRARRLFIHRRSGAVAAHCRGNRSLADCTTPLQTPTDRRNRLDLARFFRLASPLELEPAKFSYSQDY